jgi:DnaJ-domain-containing protein 1
VRVADPLRRPLAGRQLAPLLYHLGRRGSSGLLTLTPATSTGARAEVLAVRCGAAIAGAGAMPLEPARQAVVARLERMAACAQLVATLEPGAATPLPPGARHTVPLAAWARAHLERQLDGGLAERLVDELGTAPLAVRPDLAPEPVDDADRRMLAALAAPRHLINVLADSRAPRLRLLALLHFLRAVGGLACAGPEHAVAGPARRLAPELLGVPLDAAPEVVKRAYRRLARELHPDLQPGATADERRALERRFAQVSAAYAALRAPAAEPRGAR